MRATFIRFLMLLFAPHLGWSQEAPLLPQKDMATLAEELSGETAMHNLEGIIGYHRQRGSRGFRAAAELVAERLRAYGLTGVEILQFPADGKIFYGTQRSRPAWDVDSAELWELQRHAETWEPAVLMASYKAMPITLAEDSESADLEADLVDVGSGRLESDYAGKTVRGKIVLADAQPSEVRSLAVDRFGAVGILSDAQNQHTAWWGEDENLIRWGHLGAFPDTPTKTFAFMISLKTARTLRTRLANGETIRLRATVNCGQHPGNYEVVTATILGADDKLNDKEIAFSCHLDHQRPGANDNASGCAVILEIARTLAKLIHEGKLARPARTIRFIWPPEIEGTLALVNARPDFARRLQAVIHLDMVGGNEKTKATFHVTRGPMSLPSFVYDVAEAFAGFVNEQTEKFANTGAAEYSLMAPEGGKEPLRAEFSPYSMGSDHDVYQDGSFRIPTIYLNDWPDRYIHTNFDSAANIDPTKLKRAAFIGAASGYFLAQERGANANALLQEMEISAIRRYAVTLQRAVHLPVEEVPNLIRLESEYLDQSRLSFARFIGSETSLPVLPDSFTSWLLSPSRVRSRETTASAEGGLIFVRNPQLKGPMTVLGYDYFQDHMRAANIKSPTLLQYQGLWGAGDEYAFEILNFMDGKRDARQIRNAVSGEYGPVPPALVIEYLRALEKIGVISERQN